MELRLEIPDVLAEALGSDPARAALEAMLAQLIFEGTITIGFAGDVLGLRSDDAADWYRERGHTPRPMSDEQITSGVRYWADREERRRDEELPRWPGRDNPRYRSRYRT